MQAILEATIAILAERGYSAFSMNEACDRADISRGAMLHHYASKVELMSAAVEYAFFRRMENCLARIQELSIEERTGRMVGIQVAYEACCTVEYKAYLALHLAARVDPELTDHFRERAELYDQIWHDEMYAAYPEWHDHSRFDEAHDLVWAALEGIALMADIWTDPKREVRALKTLGEMVQAIYARADDGAR